MRVWDAVVVLSLWNILVCIQYYYVRSVVTDQKNKLFLTHICSNTKRTNAFLAGGNFPSSHSKSYSALKTCFFECLTVCVVQHCDNMF